jgi:hypothetical protein
MLFLFSETTDDATRLDLEWDELRVSIPIKTDTTALTKAVIAEHVDGTWGPLARAARYYAETAKDTAMAMKLIDASLAVQETWFNSWIKAKLLADAGNYKDAYPLAQKAFELGNKDKDSFFYHDDVKKALDDWKGKI